MAFAQPDLLVIYGSSELAKEMPNNASQFFADYPTGFRVFPVGKPGTASLDVLQKVAAVGEDIRGRKVAYSISPGWFFSEAVDPKYYEGNFSRAAGAGTRLQPRAELGPAPRHRPPDARISEDARRPLAARVRAAAARRRHAGRSRALRARPALRLARAGASAAPRITSRRRCTSSMKTRSWNPHPKRGLRAHELERSAQARRAICQRHRRAGQAQRGREAQSLEGLARQAAFLQAIAHAKEWTDIELLMRTFQELGANPLLLSMPIEDIRLEVYGLLPSARTAYLDRLTQLASDYGIPAHRLPRAPRRLRLSLSISRIT